MVGSRRIGVVGALTAGFLVAHHLGRTYGSTRAERRAPMAGDFLVLRPQTTATHAVTIPAPPEAVWPWLQQVGWHRGGWYTARWVDVLFFPDNLPSADHVLPDLQRLEVGDWVPDGPPETGCGFVVREVVPEQRLVLHSTTHLPPSWRRRGRTRVTWTWSFELHPVDGGQGDDGRSTRLVFRWRARTRPWWLTAGAHLVILPADAVMSHDMLHGLRQRVGRAA